MFREKLTPEYDFVAVTKVEMSDKKEYFKKYLADLGITSQGEMLEMLKNIEELDLQAYDEAVGDSDLRIQEEMEEVEEEAESHHSEEGSADDEEGEYEEESDQDLPIALMVRKQIEK